MKKKKLAKKFCSLALALALALCCLPAAFATENKITVDFSFFNGSVVIPKTEISVYDGIAEEYGYDLALTDHNGNTVDRATAFDVIVAAHKAYYGEKFTSETCFDYLEITSSFVTKVFGINSSSLGLLINDSVPNDGIYVEAYGGYTGYAFDTAQISSGDYVSLYTYQNPYYADYCVILSDNKINIDTNKEFIISASGYSAMWYGTSTAEVRELNTYKLAGLDVFVTDDFVNYEQAGILDENGEIKLSFSGFGTVYICITGNFEDPTMGKVPAVANWCEVSVTDNPETDSPPENPEDTIPPDEPEDDYSDALYIPSGFEFSVDTDYENGCLKFDICILMKDIRSGAPVKTENIFFEVDISYILKIINFLTNVF